jgi:hypothetical protein
MTGFSDRIVLKLDHRMSPKGSCPKSEAFERIPIRLETIAL